MAVERMRTSDNIVALSQELGVHRRVLYHWRGQEEALDGKEESPRRESSQLKQALEEKMLD